MASFALVACSSTFALKRHKRIQITQNASNFNKFARKANKVVFVNAVHKNTQMGNLVFADMM
jgi:hypothetical protein